MTVRRRTNLKKDNSEKGKYEKRTILEKNISGEETSNKRTILNRNDLKKDNSETESEKGQFWKRKSEK